MQALGEVVEKALQIALLGDSFADVEEGFELAAIVVDGGSGAGTRGRRIGWFSHKVQDSTRFRGVSTELEKEKWKMAFARRLFSERSWEVWCWLRSFAGKARSG